MTFKIIDAKCMRVEFNSIIVIYDALLRNLHI